MSKIRAQWELDCRSPDTFFRRIRLTDAFTVAICMEITGEKPTKWQRFKWMLRGLSIDWRA